MPETMQAFLAEQYGSTCYETVPDSCGFIIFGASGDLTSRKLIPSLYQLHCQHMLPTCFYILGCARSTFDDDSFRLHLADLIPDKEHWNSFAAHIHYFAGDYADQAFYPKLQERLNELARQYGTQNQLFYLATPPAVVLPVITGLGNAKLLKEDAADKDWRRVIVEKPFGTSLVTAREAFSVLGRHLTERQLYRIDHYLGKETVQNILISRFANTLFEPIWNRQFVDHIQITAAETIGIGSRAGYYEQAGAVRDMFQNHMLQMLSLVAMEPPASFDADRYRDEKVKLLRAIRPVSLAPDEDAIRGQYDAVPGQVAYRSERGVAADSQRETYAALRLFIDNWRWAGVPFYLRSGKCLAGHRTEVAVHFKQIPHSMFVPIRPEQLAANTLVFTIQPDEGIHLSLETKRPGPKMCMSCLKLRVHYHDLEEERTKTPDAYARLLLDAMGGDQTLFVRNDDVEQAWTILDPLLAAWEQHPERYPLHTYAAGTNGPAAADELLTRDQRRWRPL